jgi:hypothetical protein
MRVRNQNLLPELCVLTMNQTGPSMTSQQDDIHKSLNAIGAYTHLNNLQLLPTGVEEARYGKASKVGSNYYVYDFEFIITRTVETTETRTRPGIR